MNRNVRLQVRAVGAGVDRYLAVSRHVRDRLVAGAGLPQHKLRLVSNGIDPDAVGRAADPVLRARLAGAPDRPLVLAAARLSPQKAIGVLLAAAPLVPDAVFVIAGDGPERASLEAHAQALGIAGRVRFLGLRDDVPELLAVCDVFVLPSLFEGLPLSVLEAMAAAKPVVATRIPGTDEAVVDGATGILVPPGNAPALAAAIRAFLSDPVRAAAAGRAGLDRVRTQFSASAMVAAVAAEYEALLHS